MILSLQEDNQMFSKEVTQKIGRILESRGYFVTENVRKADYALLFNFGITSTQTTINVPKYIPGQSQTTQGSVYGSSGGYGSYQQTTQTSGTTVYVPENYIFFTRALAIDVYDAKLYRKNKKIEELWKANAISSGESGDLRYIIDYLLVTAFAHFGGDTGKYVEKELSVDDREVRKLRGEICEEFDHNNDYSQSFDYEEDEE